MGNISKMRFYFVNQHTMSNTERGREMARLANVTTGPPSRVTAVPRSTHELWFTPDTGA